MESIKTKVGVLHVGEPKHRISDLYPERSSQANLEELLLLAKSIDLDILFSHSISLQRIKPSSYIGSGIVDIIKQNVQMFNLELMILDAPLSAIQQRNLEKAWNCKVIDKTGLILEIFGARARTAEGSLQVELAALLYQRSRLVRSWTHLERQRGGFGFTGGPGESQLELDRRLIDTRIISIKKQLEKVKKTRLLHRKSRKKSNLPQIALVGYTNAGKSTLFNLLTSANVFAQDQLFATLDPTLRQIKLPSGRNVIISDTVGFISKLPTQLVAAFRATLEEVCEADLILHVRDISHPDTEAQKEDVEITLKDLGLEDILNKKNYIEVLNKSDLLLQTDHEYYKNLSIRNNYKVLISAIKNEGILDLLKKIDDFLLAESQIINLKINTREGKLLAWCYKQGIVIERSDHEDMITLILKVNLEQIEFIKKKFINSENLFPL